MGNQQTNGNYVAHQDSQRQLTDSTEYKESNDRIDIATKLCEQINKCCDKDKALKTLQTKLAILEIKTFSKIKYSNKTCGHPKCKKPAPSSFPESDAFLCHSHLTEISQQIEQNMTSKSKSRSLKYQIDSINKTADGKTKKIIKVIYKSFLNVRGSFNKGSINNISKLPKNYWSLLMTKLLTVLNYLKLDKKKDHKSGIQLIENLMKLLLLYRFVMNPTAKEILEMIVIIIAGLIPIVLGVSDLISAVDYMVRIIVNSTLFGYAAQFLTALSNSLSGAEAAAAAGAIIGGSAMSATGAAVAVSAAIPGIGLAVGGGILIGAGVIYLIQKYRQNQQQAAQVGDQVLNQMQQNTQELANNNNLQQLEQQLADLQGTNG